MKLRFKTGDDVEISTWKWVTAHMPTATSRTSACAAAPPRAHRRRLHLPVTMERPGRRQLRPSRREHLHHEAAEGDLELSEMAFDGGGVGTHNGSNKAVNNPIIAGYQTGGNWAARLTSELAIADAGEYKLYLRLGDADTAKLYINGELVISTGRDWGRSKVHTVKKVLEAGHHKVVVHYADDGWADRLRVTYSGPDTLGRRSSSAPSSTTRSTSPRSRRSRGRRSTTACSPTCAPSARRSGRARTTRCSRPPSRRAHCTDYVEANEACGERFGAMIDLKQFDVVFDYCVPRRRS